MASSLTVPFRPSDIPTGLVGYWKFNNDATDSSGKSYDLTAVNSPTYAVDDYWKTGEYSTDLVPASNHRFTRARNADLDLLNKFTISFWAKLDGVTNTAVVNKDDGGDGYGIFIQASSLPQLWMNNGARVSGTAMVANKWEHWTFVYDQVNCYVYRNGNLDAVAAYSTDCTDEATDLTIGANGAGNYDLDGHLKDLAFWNVALTPLQIKSLALGVDLSLYAYRPNNVSTQPTNYWRLNEISGRRVGSLSDGTQGVLYPTQPMTANNAPSPYVASASSENGGYKAYLAFTNGASAWISNGSPTASWLKIDLGTARTITNYVIVGYATTNANPKTWTFEGSNNDSDWTTLDTRASETSWASGQNRQYSFSNSTAYRYYKLNITAGNGNANLAVAWMELFTAKPLSDNASVLSAGGYIESRGADLESGNSEFLSTEDSADWDYGTDKFSFVTWFKLESLATTQCIFDSQDGNNANGGVRVIWETGNDINVTIKGNARISAASFTPVAGVWYHLAVVRRGTGANELIVYIDGVSIGAGTSNDNITGSAGTFDIGKAGATSSSTWYFDGVLADFAMWKGYDLTTAEIASLAAGMPIQRQGLVSYWKLNEESGNRADSIGSNTLVDSNSVLYGTGKVSNAADFEKDNSESFTIANASQTDLHRASGDQLTVMTWFKQESQVAYTAFVNAGYVKQYVLSTGATGAQLYFQAVNISSSGGTLSNATWYFACATLDGTNQNLYLNAVSVDSDANAGSFAASTDVFHLGDGSAIGFGGSFFDGLMDETVIAKRYFRPDEIKAAYLKGLNGKEITSTEVTPATTQAQVIWIT